MQFNWRYLTVFVCWHTESALSESSESLSRAESSGGALVGGASDRIDSSLVLVSHTSAPGARDVSVRSRAAGDDKQQQENEKLLKQLEKYRDIIEQQETFIQVSHRRQLLWRSFSVVY